MIGGGTGPSAGTNATTCTPSPFYMRHMLAATDSIPINFMFTGKGNDAGPEALEDIVKAGAGGLKLHEVSLWLIHTSAVGILVNKFFIGLGFHPSRDSKLLGCWR